MPIEITSQLVSTVVCELIRYRDRVDLILTVKEAGAGLPFLLPPAPSDESAHLDDMVRFFATPAGQAILILQDLADEYELFLTDPTSLDNQTIAATRQRLFPLYFEAAQFRPARLGPTDPVADRSVGSGPEVGLRLAWYVVESQRLSRQPAFVNLLLATTDTLLEIVGQNAGLFVRHPRTRGIVESLLGEFALKGDLEDQSFLLLFRRLLGSTVLAFGEERGKVRNQTALKVFYAALSRVRKTLGRPGDDLAAALISAEGFEQFLVAITSEVARDPKFLIRDQVASDVLAAMLTRICRDYPLLLNDSRALLGVVEAGLGAAAVSTAALIDPRPGGSEPLLAEVLAAVLREVGVLGRQDVLLASIANGEVVPCLYLAALKAIATTPLKFAIAGEAQRFTAELVSGLAKLLASQELKALGSTSTLQLLAIESLQILSRHPGLLAGHNIFATNLLASVLQAGTVVMADGLERKDLLELADQALFAATANAALLRLETRLGEAILAAGRGIATANLNELVDAKGRMAILNAALRAISANPPVWSRLQEQKLVEPLVRGLLIPLKADGTGILTGARCVECASRLLQLLARRGQLVIEKKIDLNTLQAFLTMTVKRLEREMGRTIDGEAQPYLIERIATAILDTPARLKLRPEAFIEEILPAILTDLGSLWGRG